MDDIVDDTHGRKKWKKNKKQEGKMTTRLRYAALYEFKHTYQTLVIQFNSIEKQRDGEKTKPRQCALSLELSANQNSANVIGKVQGSFSIQISYGRFIIQQIVIKIKWNYDNNNYECFQEPKESERELDTVFSLRNQTYANTYIYVHGHTSKQAEKDR